MPTFWWIRIGLAATRELEVYGWASWSPRKGILVLRNPSDQPQNFSINLTKAFDLPGESAHSFRLRSPWKEDSDTLAFLVQASQPYEFHLKPFEVLVFDATPWR